MKILNIIALASVMFAGSMSAFADGKIAIGAQGGFTFPDYNFKNTTPGVEYGKKDGALGGVFAEFGLSSITIRPEVNYVTKPYKVVNVAEVKNHYIEVPILLKINPFGKFVVSPFLVLGPQWSTRTSSTVTALGSSATYKNTENRWDLSALGGLGVEVNVSEHLALNVQGRYEYGFRNLDSGSADVKSRAFYALAGLALEL